MDWLINLIPGGGLTFFAGLAAALLAALGYGAKKAHDAGVNKQKAKEAEARARNMERIQNAARAKPARSVHDDPHNRDNR